MATKVDTTATEKVKSVFDELSGIDVNEHKEEKNGLSYLSWSWAWSELQKRYPDASYTIEKFGEMRKPYLYDEDTGYMVFTTVTIKDQTREMWLPVMDGANKAMKNAPYQYTVMAWDNAQHKKVPTKRTVQPATMFDINKAIMRCLVKNIGMFGLGLYIYSGEDLPEQIPEEAPKNQKNDGAAQQKKQLAANKNTLSIEELTTQWGTCRNKLQDLGIDIRSNAIMNWMIKHTGYQDQEPCLTDINKMQKMVEAYETLIAGAEKKAQAEKDVQGG